MYNRKKRRMEREGVDVWWYLQLLIVVLGIGWVLSMLGILLVELLK
jgi:hypothetical protein